MDAERKMQKILLKKNKKLLDGTVGERDSSFIKSSRGSSRTNTKSTQNSK